MHKFTATLPNGTSVAMRIPTKSEMMRLDAQYPKKEQIARMFNIEQSLERLQRAEKEHAVDPQKAYEEYGRLMERMSSCESALVGARHEFGDMKATLNDMYDVSLVALCTETDAGETSERFSDTEIQHLIRTLNEQVAIEGSTPAGTVEYLVSRLQDLAARETLTGMELSERIGAIAGEIATGELMRGEY